jgi:hypothetical protein
VARIAGKNGRVYLGLASSAASAEPVAFVRSWNINAETDRLGVTAMGDTSKTYIIGLPDAQVSYQAYYDDAGSGVYAAATDGQPRKFYLYPSTLDTAKYWYGTVFVSASSSSDVNGAVETSGTFAAATPLVPVGIS